MLLKVQSRRCECRSRSVAPRGIGAQDPSCIGNQVANLSCHFRQTFFFNIFGIFIIILYPPSWRNIFHHFCVSLIIKILIKILINNILILLLLALLVVARSSSSSGAEAAIARFMICPAGGKILPWSTSSSSSSSISSSSSTASAAVCGTQCYLSTAHSKISAAVGVDTGVGVMG